MIKLGKCKRNGDHAIGLFDVYRLIYLCTNDYFPINMDRSNRVTQTSIHPCILTVQSHTDTNAY